MTKTVVAKLSIISLLSPALLYSAFLMTLATPAQAAVSVNANTDRLSAGELMTYGNPANHCDSVTQAQTKYPNDQKYQTDSQKAISCMLTQLKAYQNPSMSSRQQYFAYKAQAWLNYAYHEASIKTSTAAGAYALRDGETILKALKSGNEQQLDLITDIPVTSALMRPDLWAILNALKDAGGIDSAPRELAFSEVSLVWAAADYCEHGSRQSAAYFRMADRWLEQAREAYVNAHNSQASRALEDLSVKYFKQYEFLDPSDNVCRGQPLSSIQTTLFNAPITGNSLKPLKPLDKTATLSLSTSSITTIDKPLIASPAPSIEPSASYSIAR